MTDEGKVHLWNINLWRKISIGCLFIKRRRVSGVEKKRHEKQLNFLNYYKEKKGGSYKKW